MREQQAVWFPLTLLAVLALLTTWLDYEVDNAMTEAVVRQRDDPDTLLHGFATTQTDAKGRVTSVLRGERLTHFPADGRNELLRPSGEHFPETGGRIAFKADRGTVSGDRKSVELSDGVDLSRSRDGRPPLSLQTSTLTIFPDQQRASTEAPVTIRDAHTQLRGVGLDFDARSGTLSLRSRVQVIYQKNARQNASAPPRQPARRPARQPAR